MTPKIIALLAFRDEEKYLPGYFKHLEEYVDGFICLDDGSKDNSYWIAEGQDAPTRVISRRSDATPHANEVENRKTLLEAAQHEGADWVLCCDADERYEKAFLKDMRNDFAPGIYHVRVRDLWNSPDHYRVDGIWSHKTKPVLFPLTDFSGSYCLKSDLHSTWVPNEIGGTFKPSFIYWNLYHLRSIHAEDRARRVEKFNQIDPERKHQAIGYDYLNDETGLVVEKIPEGRGYEN